MPFITQERRKVIEDRGLAGLESIQPGDRCFNYYFPMVRLWKKSPRWTTAHDIYQFMLSTAPLMKIEDRAAYHLAWQVFFQLYVMPYELKKQQENGDVE